jgi:hypothetical protein
MVEIYDFEAAKARLGVKRAERSLDQANQALDDDAGVCLSLATLCSPIGSDQLRLKDDPKQRLVTLNRPPN